MEQASTQTPFNTVGCSVSPQWFCTDLKIMKCTHFWCIKNFSFCGQYCGQRIDSDIIRVGPNGELEFILRFYPREMALYSDYNFDADKEFMSVFLGMLTNATRSNNVDVKYTIAIKSACGKTVKSLTSRRIFVVGRHRGWYDFLDRREFFSPSNGFLPADELQIRCDIVVSLDSSALSKEQYTICIPKSTLSKDVTELYKSGKYSDVVIEAGDSHFRVHRAILVARSPVFQAMFEHNMIERNCGNIRITDFDQETIGEMLNFAYSGRVSLIDKAMAEKVLAAADKYEIDSLKRVCEDYLCKFIDLNTVMELVSLSEKYCAENLKSTCMEFLSCFIDSVLSDGNRKFSDVMQPKFLDDIIDYIADRSENDID